MLSTSELREKGRRNIVPRVSRVSLDLLQTFLLVLDRDGDAMAAARELKINQPSMSKRLGVLQHAGRGLRRPWLERVGKTWEITAEGRRVLPAVRDICARYERLTRFLDADAERRPAFAFGCGRQAVVDFVLRAVQRFHKEQPDQTFRIAQLRGEASVEGVANGSLDLAAVTHEEDQITAQARRELHIDALPLDPLVLVGHKGTAGQEAPPWAKAFARLPARGATPEALRGLPLILPEPDAGIRRQIDQVGRSAGVLGEWNVVLEIGGWQTILAYARAGLGVGVVTRSVFERQAEGLDCRPLDPRVFAPSRVRLICRRRSTSPEDLDLTPAAARFRDLLLQEGRSGS
jgi:DNA-binding transcriptional LysR family regulator